MSENGETWPPGKPIMEPFSAATPGRASGCFMSSFQVIGLPYEPFAQLFALPDGELRKLNAQRVVADSRPGYPCRVSLTDAEIGEELLLLPYQHQPAQSPYRAFGPIFVRKHAIQRTIEPGVIPEYVGTRLMSIRAYDALHQMIDATACPGSESAAAIRSMFSNPAVGYLHLHNANRGCFSCTVQRA
jgi:hypothetical protein